jgi:hypothetical protein
VLDSNADGARRDRLLRAMRVALNRPDLRFYAEIWSYTPIVVGTYGGYPPGFFFVCDTYPTGHVVLDQPAFDGQTDDGLRNLLLHESYHAFNCHEKGLDGALNEGAGIWVSRRRFLRDSIRPRRGQRPPMEPSYGTATSRAIRTTRLLPP